LFAGDLGSGKTEIFFRRGIDKSKRTSVFPKVICPSGSHTSATRARLFTGAPGRRIFRLQRSQDMLWVAPGDNTNTRTPKEMNKILSVSAFAVLMCVASVSAQAAQGCGAGEHRGPDGRCYQNGAVVVAPAPAVVVVEPPAGVVCGPGTRWHPGRHRCWAY
jgi:hypothetical protein